MDERVGLRELRQRASTYVGRAAAAERFVVTDRGRPVAVLAAFDEDDDPVARDLAAGVIAPAQRPRQLPDPLDLGAEATAGLVASRDEDRW